MRKPSLLKRLSSKHWIELTLLSTMIVLYFLARMNV